MFFNPINSENCLFSLRHACGTIIIISLIISCAMTLTRSPYDVLGVSKHASQEQIKRSYKDLARKLHPDKSNLSETESESRFIELNQAFTLLKDPEKRRRYDQTGETEDSPRHHRRRSDTAYGQKGFRTFTFHDGHATFEFKFDSNINSAFKKNSISARQYYQQYLPLSKKKVFYIFLYSDFCQLCNLIEPTWTKLSAELEKYGIGFITLNVQLETQLARDLGATSIPYIVSLVDEKVRHYHYNDITLANLIEFTKSILPSNLILQLNDDSTQDRFISSGTQNNRLRALIINRESRLKLRYLLIALEFRDRYQFGHVSTKKSQHKLLMDKYKVNNEYPTILIFDEDYQRPINFLQVINNRDFQRDDVRELLLKQQYLQLPRITSQSMLDDLCIDLSDGTQIQKKLCIILLASNIPKDEPTRTMLRKFIKFHDFHNDKGIAFAYIDPMKQEDFVLSLMEDGNSLHASMRESPIHSIFILRKLFNEENRAKYSWVSHKWDVSRIDELDLAKLDLLRIINIFRRDKVDLPFRAALKPIVDEEAPSLLKRIEMKIVDFGERLYRWITKKDGLHILILISLTVVMLTYYIIRFFRDEMKGFKEFTDSNQYKSNSTKNNGQGKHRTDMDSANATKKKLENDVKLIELKAETYNGLVRLLKPGCRSIILLCDAKSEQKLLPLFTNIVRPYRR